MRVLIATGGSSHSNTAVQVGRQLAHLCPVKVTLLTVIKQEAERETAEAVLAEARAYLQPAIVEIDVKIRLGQTAEEIGSEANEGLYELLILGERSAHGLLTRLLGPTALRVIDRADCPILIAKASLGPPARLLICDSGGQTPNLLDRLAARLSEFLDALSEVTVLHVMSQISAAPGLPGEDLRANAAQLIAADAPEGQLLQDDLDRLRRLQISATPKIRHGLVVDEILAECHDGRYDLVVIGRHQGEGWQRFLLADIARQIVTRADRSVLICP